MDSKKIIFFDTTLRDGEQAPGCSMNLKEKVAVAKQLARLGVDVIEAGFAISSPGDFDSVKAIADSVQGPTICSLARSVEKDIKAAGDALQNAEKARIHIFLATSDIHLKYKLKMTHKQMLQQAIKAVQYAKTFTSDVEFSAEDAFRSDRSFLKEVVEAVIAAGAKTVNLPDTVGYALPWEYGEFIKEVKADVPNVDQAVISVHCHNDLGLAVANSLSAVYNGAQQVEVSVNGIGERAGNAALEELAMALVTRHADLGFTTGINTEEIYRTSRLVSQMTGMPIPANKAIIGKNAFLHESGIHQDGVLKERTTYEIMNPKMIGISEDNLVLGKHSGRHAFKKHMIDLGYDLEDEALNEAFEGFKNLCDKKKEILDEDLIALVDSEVLLDNELYAFHHLHVFSGTDLTSTATIGVTSGGEKIELAALGQGPVDAAFAAIDQVVGKSFELEDYRIDAVTPGQDAQAEVRVKVRYNGKTVNGRGISTSVLEASSKAYLNAINKALFVGKNKEGGN